MSLTKPRKSRACVVAILVGASWLTVGSRAEERATPVGVPAATEPASPPARHPIRHKAVELPSQDVVESNGDGTFRRVPDPILAGASTAPAAESTESGRRRPPREAPPPMELEHRRVPSPDGTFREVVVRPFDFSTPTPATQPAASAPVFPDLRSIDRARAQRQLEAWKRMLVVLGGGLGVVVMALGTVSLFRLLFGRHTPA